MQQYAEWDGREYVTCMWKAPCQKNLNNINISKYRSTNDTPFMEVLKMTTVIVNIFL